MKRTGITILILFLTSTAIFAQEKATSQSVPSKVAFHIDEKDLFPEGITYDSKTKQFFLGSINKEKVVVINKAGHQSDFIQPKQDGMMRSLGLKVDVARRRLWVVSNSDWDDSVISAIHIYNIDTKKLIKSFFTAEGPTPTFNDLVLTNSGAAYISDWAGNSIYYIPSDLDKVEFFIKSDSLLVGANGLALSDDNSLLYVASHTRGIVMVDLESKSVNPVSKPINLGDLGIDGLVRYKNTLIGVLNGEKNLSDHYIARYYLSKDGHEIVSKTVIDHKNPLFNEPTSGVIVGHKYYCLAATFLRLFGSQNSPEKHPLVLKYNLLE